ncbi:RNA-directed DNA polymerase [Pseudoalteromonas shioyasakiensis]|uniref:RNA-directed DNA polymerase n=1 Tax=Pseudoalteromonas shioyasakiensis TaxID=1190813 RepID=UPI002551C9C8|nr:RNA-directed DNA polymerase [Pseudoalteromonas shioyasakiensis]MDK9682251.1 RNA-directed DNA polymerase [Pseudoalteromonas shioyasakiensis]
MKNFEFILARAFNSYKVTAPLTSLGIKCLANQMDSDRTKSYLSAILKRKLSVNKNLTIRNSKVLKSRELDVDTYRYVVTPSPLSALMEAEFFRELAANYNEKDYVYSYRLPKVQEKSYRNFQYYYDNYVMMNKNILSSMIKNKCDSVLIIDLKAFYPSIDVNQVLSEIEQEGIFYESVLNTFATYQNGLPIGLDTSHLLAQHYLKDFDIQLSKEFKGKYFRYVDDIFIVCDKSNKESIISFVDEHLPSGLQLNEDKLDIANEATWKTVTSNIEERRRLDSFVTYFSIFIAFNSSELEQSNIKELLERNGFYIPIYKFSDRVQTSTFSRFFEILLKERFKLVFTISRWSNEDLVSYCKNRKVTHLSEVKSSINEIERYQHRKDIVSRFKIQNIKYHLGNLFYLLNDDELIDLKNDLQEHSELAYFGAIVDALINNDFNSVLELGGKHIMTLADMWLSRGKTPVSLDVSKMELLDDFSESLLLLNLIGVIKLDLRELAGKFADKNQYEFISSIIDREIPRQLSCEYSNELASLFKPYSNQQLKDMLKSEFDRRDDIVFYGIENGGY